MDTQRELERFQDDLLLLQEDDLLKQMRSGCCMFDMAKECNHCFSCIGLIHKKLPEELNAFEAAKLLEYKLYNLNLDAFSQRVNEIFHRNGGRDQILYCINLDIEQTLAVRTEIVNPEIRKNAAGQYGEGDEKHLYALPAGSVRGERQAECGSDPCGRPGDFSSSETSEGVRRYSVPAFTEESGDLSTHSPNLLSNFTSRQIRQVFLNEDGYPEVKEKTDISAVLDDLGYSANDLMNVNFVFIVEGKQDKSRLPLLIRKYYSETY